MTPIDPEIFGLELRVFAKDQPEYVPLPARVDEYGTVVTCWQLTLRQRLALLWRGKFYVTMLTFNKPLQPIRVSVDKPEIEEIEK